ncbi:hypothetical protein XANCAGTX0491_000004 [Xanthoria calcicola]
MRVSSRQRLISEIQTLMLCARDGVRPPLPEYLGAILTQSSPRAITPPPDEEEDAEEARVLEAQARQDLERDGCPPCYPPNLDIPLRNPPEEYRQIIDYWSSFKSTVGVVLCAQRSDWRRFQDARRRLRYRYRNKSFALLEDEIRQRRRAHGLDDTVHLLLDPQQQIRQQNWIEFQDYHLKLHESQEKRRDGWQKDLDTRLSDHAARLLETTQRLLRRHEVMLRWIEQCRLAMDPPPPTSVEKGSGGQTSSSDGQRRSKRQKSRAVLGKVGVSKPAPKNQDGRTRMSKGPTSQPLSLDSSIKTPGSTQQMPKHREMKPRRAKEKALGQLLPFPQKVVKANRFAATGTRSRLKAQCSGDGQIRDRVKPQPRSGAQRLHPTPRIIKTRSQRISREPVRWAPE